MEFENKVAVVTGAGSGIGRATALALAREGAHVIVADIDPAGGEATADAIRQQAGQAAFMPVDMTDPECDGYAVEITETRHLYDNPETRSKVSAFLARRTH